jgi:hypothetical protein
VLTRAAAGLGGFLNEIRRRLAGADVVGFDETGFRVAGKFVDASMRAGDWGSA